MFIRYLLSDLEHKLYDLAAHLGTQDKNKDFRTQLFSFRSFTFPLSQTIILFEVVVGSKLKGMGVGNKEGNPF